MTRPVFDEMVSLAARRDLESLHRELQELLAGMEESHRPYVPAKLARSLDMFLESYGPSRQGEDR
ncbi:hypothetical protein CLV92_110148 [Kineococcus xinjiangensis]|uniref:Uncharacterized protein n=1 Tax=Kineococcus xinjiangensis TaxID=512762 RepID=A0A2S6IH65_9ACTN|nr:hypothetical protein [Kineococcus xinjiangensis]PPK93520.1 hypothetical protein CLV92_110148 [Kineococcus xinjiangensis]